MGNSKLEQSGDKRKLLGSERLCEPSTSRGRKGSSRSRRPQCLTQISGSPAPYINLSICRQHSVLLEVGLTPQGHCWAMELVTPAHSVPRRVRLNTWGLEVVAEPWGASLATTSLQGAQHLHINPRSSPPPSLPRRLCSF